MGAARSRSLRGMSLAEQIQTDLTTAMKARDKVRTTTLRSVLAGAAATALRLRGADGLDLGPVSDEHPVSHARYRELHALLAAATSELRYRNAD